MIIWRAFVIICITTLQAQALYHSKRNTPSNICDPTHERKIQCYCVKDEYKDVIIRSADCYLISEKVTLNDTIWQSFNILEKATKLSFTNTRGITLKYIPTFAFNHTNSVEKIDIKYGHIEHIQPYTFANLSSIKDVTLRGNQIASLSKYAFAHHKNLEIISLDDNNIVEVNREVFFDLPSLKKLYLTSNKITTLHDLAFIHLGSLQELEIDRNNIFSLNSEIFSGLVNLQKLDLSGNSLEVIGDHTFLPLHNLLLLNLDGNKLEMIDEYAFDGLDKLKSLSLAHNKLKKLENTLTFSGLNNLISLNLRGNQIVEIKPEVMAPILNNFHGSTSSLDVEGNSFPCSCRLDWFVTLMNTTRNNQLKLALENLKCMPDPVLKDLWKTENTEKEAAQVFEDEDLPSQNVNYEYYDESQLNGELFYIDIRDLLNCTKIYTKPIANNDNTLITTQRPSKIMLSKAITSSIEKTTTNTPKYSKDYKPAKVTNKGVLDLSIYENSGKPAEIESTTKTNMRSMDGKQNAYTTNRLVTVSAKPTRDKNKFDDQGMASDEGKPDQLKIHRSVQEEVNYNNDSHRHYGCAILILLGISLLYFNI